MTRTPLLTALVLSLAVAAPACARADTYRCQLPSGNLEYRDTPCPLGTQRVIDTTPATGSVIPPTHREHWSPSGPVQRSADLYSFAPMRMGVRQALEWLVPGPARETAREGGMNSTADRTGSTSNGIQSTPRPMNSTSDGMNSASN